LVKNPRFSEENSHDLRDHIRDLAGDRPKKGRGQGLQVKVLGDGKVPVLPSVEEEKSRECNYCRRRFYMMNMDRIMNGYGNRIFKNRDLHRV
jgi:hypothetical protein